MDPLSLAASIAGLISLTLTVSKTTTDYVGSVKHAAEEAVQLGQELSALKSALDSLDCFLASKSSELKPFSSTSALVSTTASCHASLKALQAVLDRFIKASGGRKWYKVLAWPLKKDDHAKAVDSIRHFTQIFHFSLSIDGCELLSKATDEVSFIRETQIVSAEMIADVRELQQNSARQELLNWLCASADPSIIHNLAVQKREPETGNWFLESDQFIEWLSSAGFVWLYGIPGCGKTVLCSTIIEATKDFCAASTDRKLAYFYFDFQRPAEHDVAVLLRSLLRQVCADEASVPTAAQGLFAKNKEAGSQPSVKDLESALFSVIGSLEKDVYVILDALDEVPENAQKNKRGDVLKLLERIVTSKYPNLHVLVTSRNEADIRSRIASLSIGGISIQGSNVDADIRKYVRSCLMEDDRLCKLSPSIRETIETTLGEKAKGMFRWAYCQMEDIRTCRRPSDIKRVLAGLPTTLDETYERLLVEMSKHDAEEGLSILTWMVFAKRPLTLQEVADAAVVRPGDNALDQDDKLFDASEVLRICRSLITVSTQYIYLCGDHAHRDIMTFSHFSVQEYLRSGRSEVFRAWSHSAHRYIGDSCLSSLLQLRDPELTEDMLQENHVLRYAAEHWHTHLGQLDYGGEDASLSDRLCSLFDPAASFYCNWLRIKEPGELSWSRYQLTLEDVPPPLYYAGYLGFSNVARRLIEAGADVNGPFYQPGNGYARPLHGASIGGKIEVVQLLLDNGADVNALCHRLGTPLQIAVEGGREEVVWLLLRRGADVNSRSSKFFDSILQAALHRCRPTATASKMANILLDHGADINRPGKRHGPALAIACSYRMEQIIERLLEAGADVNAPGSSSFGNALQRAVRGGNIKIVKWLLDRNADVNALGCYQHGNALYAAAKFGYLQIAEWLIEKGADIDAPGGPSGSALQIAAYRGNVELVDRLLDLGANIDNHGGGKDDAGTALKGAAEKGHEQVVRLLLRRGADVNVTGGKGGYHYRGTALQGASRRGHLEILLMLLDAGADVNLPGRDYGTALQAAAERGHYEVVQLLLARGADVNAQGDRVEEEHSTYPLFEKDHFKHHGNALQTACAYGHYQIAQLLLDSGADANAVNEDYGTALKAAQKGKREQIIVLLKSRGAVERVIDDDGEGDDDH